MTLDDLMEASTGKRSTELKKLLESLSARYHLDFAGHLEQLYHAETLHKTVEYMRKRAQSTGMSRVPETADEVHNRPLSAQ